MHSSFSVKKILLSIGFTCLLISTSFGDSKATITNPGFDTFISTTDSFTGWKYTKDTSKYIVTQETDSAYGGTGSLKMQINDTTDTSTSVTISTTISGLSANKIFTITAWYKFVDIKTSWNAQISLQQATLEEVDTTWVWTDRDWLSLWGSGKGTKTWSQLRVSDTTADSANVFNLIITLSKKGTLWLDSITVTYRDTGATPIINNAIEPQAKEYAGVNHIVFSHSMPYTLEACALNGKMIMRKSGIAASVDLNKVNLVSGAYIMKVKTSEKNYTSRVFLSK
jgi:hypothetical protein